jgi:opacity protein-like surface antigen
MIGRICLMYRAGIGSRALARSGILLLATFSTSAVYAQCTPNGLNPPPSFPTQTAATAVAGASAYVGTVAASIHSANTAFLAQSSAFVSAPPNPAPDQPGGGIWARGVGGHMTFDTTATAGNISFGSPVAGNVVCNTRTLADFAGLQIGADIARLNVGGWNLHTGSTIGYLGLKSKDGTPSGLNPPASFSDSLQIPFAGLYFAASKGGLLIDGQVRWTFFQNDVSDVNHGMSGQPFDARSVSVTGNIGYNYDLGNQWFVEPSAGLIWSRTQVDTMNVPGTLVYGFGGVPPWTLAVKDIDSTLGRLSVRVGTTVAYDNVVLQPFASASVFHEFQGRVTSSLTSDFSAINTFAPTLSSTVSVNGLGTYGQFGLGVAAQALNSGWVSYLRGDYRKGDNIEGWSLNGGVRYQFVPERTGPLIAKAPIYKSPARETEYNWAGFYAGAQLGATWGHARWTLDGAGTVEPRVAGLLGGGEIGFNHQVGRWVFGLQGDLNWSNAHGARPCPNGFFYSCESELDFLATTTARIGYAYWDRLLVYAKGGVAIARDRDRFSCNTGSHSTVGVLLTGCPSQSDTNTKAGWTIGWGTEFGLTRTISIKSETSYVDLGTDRFSVAGVPTEVQRNGFTSTIGLRVRLGQ